MSEVWTEQALALLKTMWAKGLSASAISDRIPGSTRNSVMGKVHRLKLARQRPAFSGGGRAEPANPPPRAEPRHGNKGLPKVNAIVAKAQRRRTEPDMTLSERSTCHDVARFKLTEIPPGGCHWPVGDPLKPDFGFCGEPAEVKHYCRHHYQRSRIGGHG